jgi:hypothetical protein
MKSKNRENGKDAGWDGMETGVESMMPHLTD